MVWDGRLPGAACDKRSCNRLQAAVQRDMRRRSKSHALLSAYAASINTLKPLDKAVSVLFFKCLQQGFADRRCLRAMLQCSMYNRLHWRNIAAPVGYRAGARIHGAVQWPI
jgi:hypothetical protein